MFLGLLDPDADSLIIGTDPDPSIIKIVRKNLDSFLLFCDFLNDFYL